MICEAYRVRSLATLEPSTEDPSAILCSTADPSTERISGPFSSEEAFVTGLVKRYEQIVVDNNHPCANFEWYAAHLGRVLRGHAAVFTHADVQRKNIMVGDRASGDSESGRPYDVHVVDWEDAGCTPTTGSMLFHSPGSPGTTIGRRGLWSFPRPGLPSPP